ncbi:MAG TPA: MarR family transcriptional regulator [Holophagaceae bacterium]|nr:MarR family transcriptional regulator [Holophagaceae bacterium]
MGLELIPALHRATHRVALELSEAGPTPSQGEAQLLVHLLQAGACTVGALHAALGHRRSTLTAILDRLERAGWARRGLHAADRRSFLVELTPTGRSVAERALEALSAMERRWKAKVSAREWAAAQKVLKAISAEA